MAPCSSASIARLHSKASARWPRARRAASSASTKDSRATTSSRRTRSRSSSLRTSSFEPCSVLKLQFNANQQHQLDAVAAIADLFNGQRRSAPEYAVIDMGAMGGLFTGQQQTE